MGTVILGANKLAVNVRIKDEIVENCQMKPFIEAYY